MRNQLPADDDFILWMLLNQVRHIIYLVMQKEHKQYGISTMRAIVLFYIKAIETIKGEATPTEISRWMIREPHTISSIIAAMEKEGLVSKVKNPVKKSVVNVTLTEKGNHIYKESLKRKSLREILSCLSAEERQLLDSSLEKLRDEAMKNLSTKRKEPFP